MDILDQTLYQLVKDVFIYGLDLCKVLIEDKKYQSKKYDVPTLSWDDNGFPKFFSSAYSSSTVDYSAIFSDAGVFAEETKADRLIALLNYITTNSRLKKFYLTDKFSSQANLIIVTIDLVGDLIDTYIYKHSSFEYDEQNFLQLYIPQEQWLFTENPKVQIVVPINFVKFSVDYYELSDTVALERLSDKTQIARMKSLVTNNQSPVPSQIASLATHALTFTDKWTIPNENIYSRINATSDNVLHEVDEVLYCTPKFGHRAK